MMTYRGLLIERRHLRDCDHRAVILRKRRPNSVLGSVSAGTQRPCLEAAKRLVDEHIIKSYRALHARRQQRARLYVRLRTVSAGLVHCSTQLEGYASVTLPLQQRLAEILACAAEAGVQLQLNGVIGIQLTQQHQHQHQHQHQRISVALYRGRGRLLPQSSFLPVAPKHRLTHCYNCRSGLDSRQVLACSAFGSLICLCGACGCQFHCQYF